MSLSVREHDDGTVELVAKGFLTIDTARETAETIRAAFDRGGRVTLAFDEVQDADLTIIQILCSACRTASLLSREFMVSGEISAAVKRVVEEVGGERRSPCRHNSGLPCVWFRGGV
ncbi:MAG: hypothetical protein Fur0034_16040 [Desulfuromonadia bacterium]